MDFGTLSYTSKTLAGLVRGGHATRVGNTWKIPYVAYEITDGLGDRGVTPTASSFPFNVIVTDKGDGTLTCTTDLSDGDLAFLNTYATGKSVSIGLNGSKQLRVPEGLDGTDITGKFTFTVEGEAGAPMPTRTSTTNDANGKELSGPAFTFTNSYSVKPISSSVTDQIKVHKTLTGRDLAAGEFTFELVEDGSVIATGTNDASGNVAFGSIEYKRPGDHHYTIREHGHGTAENGVTFSDASYGVTTTVRDNGDGTLIVKHVLDDAATAEFENVYTAKSTKLALTAAKVLEGADLKAGQFTFKLSGDGVELTATNDANGQVTFSELSFTQAGTYTFTISEVNDGQQGVTYDEAERKVTVTVEDNRQGNLIASVNQDEVAACVFRNAYTKPEEPAKPTTPPTPSTPTPPTKFTPKTGDPVESAPLVVGAVLGVAVLGIALVVSKRGNRG